jgi:uncharacterized membrane protein (Fun14 family)
MSIVDSFSPPAVTLREVFFVGLLIGYAIKKVIKIVAVIVGLFLARLAHLQYHQIANKFMLITGNITGKLVVKTMYGLGGIISLVVERFSYFVK